MQKDLGDRIYQQKSISLVLKEVKQFFTDLFEKSVLRLEQKDFNVTVKNPDTNLLKEITENLRKSRTVLRDILEKEVPKFPSEMNVRVVSPLKVEFPKFSEPKSEVKITNFKDFPVPKPPTIEKIDISSLEKLLKDVKTALLSINGQLPNIKQEKITIPAFPKPEKFPNSISIKESDALLEQLQDVNENLVEVHKAITEIEVGSGGSSGNVSVSTPTITNVNVNALRGLAKSTAITVGTAATLLPSTPLQYRKSLVVFNNSSNTIYLGGLDVSISNGLPISAASYSPSIDAGDQLNVYAIAATGSNDIRVYEVSSEREGA